MIGENRQLVTNEPVEVQNCRKITDHLRGIYRIYPTLIMEIKKNSWSLGHQWVLISEAGGPLSGTLIYSVKSCECADHTLVTIPAMDISNDSNVHSNVKLSNNFYMQVKA
jgi:hypothetical protein